MSRKERFTPQEKEQACIDYIEGNRSRSEICRELYISTSTMNIPVRRVLPHENIQMVGLTTTELSNKTSNNWLNGIATQPTDIQTGKAGFQICTESRVSEENDRQPGIAAGDVRKTGIVI